MGEEEGLNLFRIKFLTYFIYLSCGRAGMNVQIHPSKFYYSPCLIFVYKFLCKIQVQPFLKLYIIMHKIDTMQVATRVTHSSNC